MNKKQLSVEELNSMWLEYKKTESIELRNRLTENYLHVVKFSAIRLKDKLPACVDLNELISVGTIGLLDAVTKFDPQNGVKFESYCGLRVRGEMIDSLREMDWVPRNVRKKSSELDKVYQALEHELGRAPNEDELAEGMGMELEDMDNLVRDIQMGGIVSLDTITHTSEDGNSHKVDMLDSNRKNNPLWQAKRKELKAVIINGLSEKEKLIIVMYYYDELTMKEIGEVLGVNESRICQIHSALIARLHSKLGQWQDEL